MSCSEATVRSNRQVSPDFYLLEAELPGSDGIPAIRAGQFCMLRSWDRIPVLSRPISVFDAQVDRITFLYKTVGQGTALLSRLRPGDALAIQGPLGKGFPDVAGRSPPPKPAASDLRIALVGGGVGIAPLYLGAKQYKAAGCTVDLYLGFSGEPFLTEEYRGLADSLTVNLGGCITDEIDPPGYDWSFTCGPEIMMRVLWEKCKAAGVGDRLFVSLESRMACGVGACYGCSRKTVAGNRKVCKDGPVFPAK